jgi:hypothetical protein
LRGVVPEYALVVTAAGFMQVPGSGVCVATARAAGVILVMRCGVGVVGLVEELGCWSVGEPSWGVVVALAGAEFSVPDVLPVVPIVDVEGRESDWPEAPVVEVVLLC